MPEARSPRRIAEPMSSPDGSPPALGPGGDPASPGDPGSGVAPDGSIGRWHRNLHRLITFAARTYYRVTVAGNPVPRHGPVLLVANHPNSLLDAALVSMAADRPMRFLAKAPLFEKRSIGWAVKGSGALPIYRREDAPELMGRNRATFEAVWNALRDGSAVGIFPEGLSHSQPSLAPLKTGTARIALGAMEDLEEPFPILPVGVTFRGGKERFRSEALLLVGKPVRWRDLAQAVREGEEAGEGGAAVRELTERIHAGLSRVTVNLNRWEDLPVVETAEAVHTAEFGRGRTQNPVRWLARMRRTAAALDDARQSDAQGVDRLAEELESHARILDGLALDPQDLHTRPRASVAWRWTLMNLGFFGLAAPLALVGTLVFLAPWKLVGWAEPRFDLPEDRRATYKVLGGTVALGGWVLILAALTFYFLGWRMAVGCLVILPLLGLLTLRIRERWGNAASDLRRFLVLKGRNDIRSRLLERQHALAMEIRSLQARLG